MANLQELQIKVVTKIKTLHLPARENHRIIKRDKKKELQQHLQLFEKRFEEIHEMKYKVPEMMIESNARLLTNGKPNLIRNKRKWSNQWQK